MTKSYAELTREIAALQASAEKLRATETKGAIAKINELIATYGLKAADLKFAATKAGASRQASKAKRVAAPAGAKFSDGQGNEWVGRGPRPAWLRDALAKGQTLESFLAGAATTAPAAPAVPVGAPPAKKSAVKATAAKRARASADKAAPSTAAKAMNRSADVATSSRKAVSGKVTSRDKPTVNLGQAETSVKAPAKKAPVKKGAAKKVAAKKVATKKIPTKAAPASKKEVSLKVSKPIKPAAASKKAVPSKGQGIRQKANVKVAEGMASNASQAAPASAPATAAAVA